MMIRLFFFVMVTTYNGTVFLAGEGTVAQDFEVQYRAWKQYISQPEISLQSTAKGRIENTFFAKIVELGPASIPYIVDKMEHDPDAIVLFHAIEKIAKMKIRGVYDKSKNKIVFPQYPALRSGENVYVYWWKEGRQMTGDQFAKKYEEWKTLKSNGKEQEAKQVYQSIMDLGIAVLPYMIEKAQEERQLLPAISSLTDGVVKPDWDVEECENWWKIHRDKWTLPNINKPTN